jgi:hypothetical protein
MEPVSGQAGRYQRSFSGLIGAIVITLVAIGAFVAVRALVRDDVEQEPQAIDYLESVGFAQESGVEVVYPAALPRGWIATSVDLVPGERPAWGLGLLTDDERFVGVRQEDETLDDLLPVYVDEEVRELPPEKVDSQVAQTWQVFEDDGGDRAYAAEVGDTTVLVYGSAGELDLRTVVEALTTEPR